MSDPLFYPLYPIGQGSHGMRILGRIVGARSAEQSGGIIFAVESYILKNDKGIVDFTVGSRFGIVVGYFCETRDYFKREYLLCTGE